MANNSSIGADEIHLLSPVDTPNQFLIVIKENKSPQQGYIIQIKNVKSEDSPKVYVLTGHEHEAYLNLFEQLSKHFGLRVPQNRRPAITPAFKATYTEVLKENLHPGILYGYGDPAVIRIEEHDTTSYYLVVTSNDAPDSFPVLRSKNLVDWEFVNYVFRQGNKPAWAADGEFISDYWAPEIHRVGDEFRIYFVARDKHTSELCIGLAKSSHPENNFIAEAEPILKGNVIDPHVFVEDSTTAYLYWKEDNNDVWPGKLTELLYANPSLITLLFTGEEDRITFSFILTLWPWIKTLVPMERFQAMQVMIEAITSNYSEFYNELNALSTTQPQAIRDEIRDVLVFMKTPMYARQLSDDGTKLVGERTQVIENDLPWEAHLVEGMWVTKHQNKYYLFYAGNDFSTDQYGIGVAISDSPLGPFAKKQKPLFQSTAEWAAPGHPSVVTGPDGLHHMFLHAFFPGKAGYKQFRALLSTRISFTGDDVLLKPTLEDQH